MNNARMWLVVKPTIGLPVFFAAIMLTSLLVHYALLTHTTWVPAFLNGGKAKAVAMAPAAPATTTVASN